jgi:hypothetical protein
MFDTYMPLLQVAAATEIKVDLVQELLLDSDSLFAAIIVPCKIIAAVGIGFQIYNLIPKFADFDELPANITKLFWSLVLAVLINNNGANARDLAIFNWATIRAINTGIDKGVTDVIGLVGLKEDYEGDFRVLRKIEDKLKICQTKAPTLNDGTPNPDFDSCKSELKTFIDTSAANGSIKNPNIIDNLTKAVGTTAGGVLSGDFNKIGEGVTKAIGSAFSDFISPILKVVFAAWRSVIGQIAQISILLAILAMPIPLCLSIFNISPLVVWFSSFWAIGIFQFNLTILTKAFEYFNVKFNTNVSVYFLDIAICIFAPAIAGLMATGGGIGIFKAILNGAGEVAKLAVNIPVAVAKKAITRGAL